MKNYKVEILAQAEESIIEITKNKMEYDLPSALRFFDEFYEDIKELHTLPERGFSLGQGRRGRIYKDHIIPYVVDDETMTVFVVDIVNPKQHTKAGKYF